MGLHRGRTQHMSLSAADVKIRCSKLHVALQAIPTIFPTLYRKMYMIY